MQSNTGQPIKLHRERHGKTVALTKDFKETLATRIQTDKAFRREILREGVECLVSGELEEAKIILRNYVNATVGFVALAEATGIPDKSLQRMFSAKGNPQAKNLLLVIAYLQRHEGIRLQVKPAKAV